MRNGGHLAGLLLTLGLASLAVPALADDRLVSQAYDPAEVVRINGKLGVQATIGFGEDEQIENVAVGDSAKWQITPNKRANLLFVKPMEASARTNMTVVTDKHTYFFDLVASPSAKPVYMLRFTYDDDPPAVASAPRSPPMMAAPAAPAAPAAAATSLAKLPPLGLPPEQQALRRTSVQAQLPPDPAPTQLPAPAIAGASPQILIETPMQMPPAASVADPVEQRIVSGDPVSAPADPATLNFAWQRKGDSKLLPSRIYDDGEATFLTWPAQRDLPAILVRNDKGEEGPVNYAVRGDTIVIDGVPGLIVLRSGRASATLRNLSGDGRASIDSETTDQARHAKLARLPSAFAANQIFPAAFYARPLQR